MILMEIVFTVEAMLFAIDRNGSSPVCVGAGFFPSILYFSWLSENICLVKPLGIYVG